MFFVFQEIPGNLYFQKTSEKWLKSGKIEKIRPLFRRLFRIQEHPRRIETSRNRNCRKNSATHRRCRANDEPPESNLPLTRTIAGERSQNPNQYNTPKFGHHRDTSGKPSAVKALHKSDYYDTPPCIRGRLGELSGYAAARGDTSGGHQLSR